MDPNYKLIYSVDPTKIKVNIQERFAKLTLSSNKKKQDAEENKLGELGQLEKNKRVSRNLLEDLQAVDGGLIREMDKNNVYINPILRSISPEKGSDLENELHLSQSKNELTNLDQSTLVDLLKISDPTRKTEENSNKTKCDYTEERLSQQFSSLIFNSNPISISSNEDLNAVGKENAGNIKLHQSPVEKLKGIPIYLSSSECDDGASSDAITVSDSSQGEDNNMVTSDIPKTGETADQFLPSTLSNDKADRIEAYLRGVSQALEQMELEKDQMGAVPAAVVFPNCEVELIKKNHDLLLADTESMTQDSSGFPVKAQKQLAFDETEPMSRTHTSAFSFDSFASTNVDGVSNQSDNFVKCVAHDETVANTIVSNLENSKLPVGSRMQTPERTRVNSSLVPEESITIPETDSEAENGNELTHISNKSLLIVDKTSAQSLRNTEMHPERDSTDENCQDSPASNKKTLSLGTQPQTPVTSSASIQSVENRKHPNTVNISAKINIKIHISQQISSDEEGSRQQSFDDKEPSPPLPDTRGDPDPDDTGSDCDRRLSCDNNRSRSVTPPSRKKENGNPKRQGNEDIDRLVYEENKHQNSTAHNKKDAERCVGSDEDPNFMEHAQKILTELYGNSWQTPEVIRSLNKSRVDNPKPFTGGEGMCRRIDFGTPTNNNVPSNLPGEESVLDDFSMFRRNIKGNLDSTRAPGITSKKGKRNIPTRTANTEGKCKSELGEKRIFKRPQTELKKRVDAGKAYNDRWRQLISDSDNDDCCNASEDDEPDRTDKESSSLSENSDKSWRKDSESDKSSSSSSDERYANSFTKRCPKKSYRRVNPKPRDNKLVYLDLSKHEVEVLEGTPVANNDENLRKRLQEILATNKFEGKPKLEATPSTTKTKRKLFTADFGNECDLEPCETQADTPATPRGNRFLDNENENINCQPLSQIFEPFNKRLEAVRTGVPVFKIQTPKSNKIKPGMDKRGYMTPTTKRNEDFNKLESQATNWTPQDKYGFLKSLDVCVGKSLCHPEALYYRDNFRQKKEELTKKLYDLYNEKLFDNKLEVSVVWNKKLTNTAGRCLNKKKMGKRISVVELSEKVLTSADRLRCTLIHELCHAATWIFDAEGGHGAIWKSWASKANMVFPEIPKIGVCHQSHAHSKSKKVENIRCSYCHGAIEVFLNKKDKDGNILPTPVREPQGFAKFVRDKYKEYKRPDLKHTDVMKILSNEFALLKVAKGN